jgi:hypothetical protein
MRHRIRHARVKCNSKSAQGSECVMSMHEKSAFLIKDNPGLYIPAQTAMMPEQFTTNGKKQKYYYYQERSRCAVLHC